jgi:hypothetical protein
MCIGIQTWGSHGDVRPFLPLAERVFRKANPRADHSHTEYSMVRLPE